MPLPIVGEDIMFYWAVRPPRLPFVFSSGLIILPRYLMNGLISRDETYRECLLPSTCLDSGGLEVFIFYSYSRSETEHSW